MKSARRPLTAVVAIGALAAAGVAATAPGAQANDRRNVPHTKPAWVADAASQGKVAGAKKTDLKVYLQPKGGIDALKAQVAAVSDPDSAQYGHYLSAAQYHATYDASDATVKAVRSYLTGQQLTVTGVEDHHRYLSVRGTNDQISKAFGVTLQKFRHQGQNVQANADPVTVPSAIASDVLSVGGLDTTQTTAQHFASTPSPPPAGFVNGRPCSAYYGQLAGKYQADYKTPLPKFMNKTLPLAVCGYTGLQLRSAYQGANTNNLDGTGVTVGIIDAYAAPTIASDANTYASNHGDGEYANGQLTQVTPASYTHANDDVCGGASGWFGEETLDVEAVHAMAPGSNIRYYGAKSCLDDDLATTLSKVVDDDKVQIVSNSYGEPEEALDVDGIATFEQTVMQGAIEGISFAFSSGDDGDELANTGIKQADASASDPYVTAVGGTATGIDDAGKLSFQTGWGTQKYSLSTNGQSWTPLGYLYGAGGGVSSAFGQPSYQQGVVPAQYSAGRAVPDVAMDADPTTGMLIGETQTFPTGTGKATTTRYGEYRIGGTSLASPLFAGQTALLIQHNGGKGLGFLNPLLYKQLDKAATISDVNGPGPDAGNIRVDYANSLDSSGGYVYSVRTFNQDSSLPTAAGWDEVTGVGAPNAGYINATVPKK